MDFDANPRAVRKGIPLVRRGKYQHRNFLALTQKQKFGVVSEKKVIDRAALDLATPGRRRRVADPDLAPSEVTPEVWASSMRDIVHIPLVACFPQRFAPGLSRV